MRGYQKMPVSMAADAYNAHKEHINKARAVKPLLTPHFAVAILLMDRNDIKSMKGELIGDGNGTAVPMFEEYLKMLTANARDVLQEQLMDSFATYCERVYNEAIHSRPTANL